MSAREALLRAFRSPGGQPHSGESLAHQLGISRVAVWKHVQALVGMGFPIQSGERTGYRLDPPFDPSLLDLTPRSLRRNVPHYFLSTRTTQALAKEGGAAGLPEGHLWIAETQTKGHGRLERVWESAYGGLWFSLLLRPKLPAARVPPLTLLAGLCLRDAIEDVTGVKAALKWPNDLFVGSQKLAGVLTEMSGQMDRTDWVVVGIGVNVNNVLSRTLRACATTLAALSGKTLERAPILAMFLKRFWPAYDRFQKRGFEPFVKVYWQRAYRPGKPVAIQTSSGRIKGRSVGVDGSGAILIESGRKIQSIFEGEIIL